MNLDGTTGRRGMALSGPDTEGASTSSHILRSRTSTDTTPFLGESCGAFARWTHSYGATRFSQ